MTLPAGLAGQGGAVGAAQRDLVPLLAVLIHAQNADVAAVVVAAAVDAAADVQVDLADVVQLVQILVALVMASAIGRLRALASAQKSPPGQAIMSVSSAVGAGQTQRPPATAHAAGRPRGSITFWSCVTRASPAENGPPDGQCVELFALASPGAWPTRLKDRVTARRPASGGRGRCGQSSVQMRVLGGLGNQGLLIACGVGHGRRWAW
jgi:hypothetical protein